MTKRAKLSAPLATIVVPLMFAATPEGAAADDP